MERTVNPELVSADADIQVDLFEAGDDVVRLVVQRERLHIIRSVCGDFIIRNHIVIGVIERLPPGTGRICAVFFGVHEVNYTDIISKIYNFMMEG